MLSSRNYDDVSTADDKTAVCVYLVFVIGVNGPLSLISYCVSHMTWLSKNAAFKLKKNLNLKKKSVPRPCFFHYLACHIFKSCSV